MDKSLILCEFAPKNKFEGKRKIRSFPLGKENKNYAKIANRYPNF